MRNYSGRLARLEAAIMPKPPVTIKIVYVAGRRDPGQHVKLSWGDAPVAVVAPGLVESLQDVTTGQPSPIVASPIVASTVDPQPTEPTWNFAQARAQMLRESRRQEELKRRFGGR